MERFAICIENKDFPASLERWKIYPVVNSAEEEGYIRIIDESGEDYLYPREYFSLIKLPHAVEVKLMKEYHSATLK